MKRIIGLLTVMTIILAMFTFNVSAASATISVSNRSPKVNNAVTVTVTVNGNEAMYGTDFNVTYNPAVLRFESGDDASGGAGVVKVAGGVTGATSKSYSLKFTAIAAGSCSISASGGAYYEVNDDSFSGSATVSVSDASKSTNANLTSLRVSAGVLSPAFSSSVTEYTVNVGVSTTECKVYGTTADPDADISVTGSATLKVGENKRVVTVTAPSGARKSYTLTIVRHETDDIPSENTSSGAESSPALEAVVDGVTYMVSKDISGVKLPKGFEVSERLYNNETVSVAIDSKGLFELFYLKSADSETVYPYIFDSEKNAFKRVQIITQMEKEYIVAELPENCSLPENYISANVKINDMSIDCYSNTDEQSADMFYIYCYFDGEFGMYRYDKLENVLQRFPELKVIESDVANVSGNTVIDRFMGLSANAKTIVVCLAVAILGVIALIVLLIVKFVKGVKTDDYDLLEEGEEFDSVSFGDDYQIIDEQDKK